MSLAPSNPSTGVSLKPAFFAFVVIAVAYVLVHNEAFVIDPAHPVWGHYEPFKWWLLPHGIAGACVILLGPMQFIDALRARHAKLHRVIGRIYVVSAVILAPIGAYIQYVVEAQGATRSFTIAAIIDAILLMTTTLIGLAFARRRDITRHRQWMTRSYAVALVFLQVRVIMGLTGWDQPMDFAMLETVVWSCLAFGVLFGDIANTLHDRPFSRAAQRGARPQTAPAE